MYREWVLQNIVPLISIVIIASAGVYSVIHVDASPLYFEENVGEETVLQGVISRDPDAREKTTHLTLKVETIHGADVEESRKVLLYADSFEDAKYGDRIVAKGTLKTPDAFETDSGRTFNYPKYLRAHGVSYTMLRPSITILERNVGNVVVAHLLSLKHVFIQGIERTLPEPESALLAGLLLGEKQSLGTKITDAFRNAGVVHIIVLSGYNVALVIQWISFVLVRLFSRNIAYVLSVIFVIAFAIMTGASETTVRAVIMALFMMLATILNRPKAALRGLCIAGALMALANPFVVFYDLSFQLSFLATLGLILFSGKIKGHLTFIPEFKFFPFREIVSTTLATQITVLPLLVVSVGAVSLVFLPANVLILPAVPLAMFVGFFVSIFSLLTPTVLLPLSVIPYAVLTYIIHVANFFGTLPFASLAIPTDTMMPVLITLSCVYVGIALLVYRYRNSLFE